MLSGLSVCSCLILSLCFIWIVCDLCLFDVVNINITQTHYGAATAIDAKGIDTA